MAWPFGDSHEIPEEEDPPVNLFVIEPRQMSGVHKAVLQTRPGLHFKEQEPRNSCEWGSGVGDLRTGAGLTVPLGKQPPNPAVLCRFLWHKALVETGIA